MDKHIIKNSNECKWELSIVHTWKQPFCKGLFYKQTVRKGFYSRYLLVFTAWQSLSLLLIIAPQLPIGSLPLFSCVQSLGLQRMLSPPFLTILNRGARSFELPLGLWNLSGRDKRGKCWRWLIIGRLPDKNILWILLPGSRLLLGILPSWAWFFRCSFSSKSYSINLQ